MHAFKRQCSCGRDFDGVHSRRYCYSCKPLKRPLEVEKECKRCHVTFSHGARNRRYCDGCSPIRRRGGTAHKSPDRVSQKSEYDRIYYQKHLKYRRTVEHHILSGAKRRSKKYGLPFNLTLSDIVIPQFCPVLGIPIFVGERGFSDNSPSLDRLRPAEGYVKGNVFVISFRANRLKSDAEPNELQLVVNYMRRINCT